MNPKIVSVLTAWFFCLSFATPVSGSGFFGESKEAAPLPAIESTRKKPPEGAPNVLLVLIDDVGFAAASTFGGPVPTPNYQEIAEQGIRFNRFHTTALCSPTRAALLTGRNHHAVEMGSITNLAFGQKGYTSVIPDTAATIGRVLQLNGYTTAWIGKNHVTPEWEVTPTGPFDRWPNGLGFDYFYGFMGGATNQFWPVLVENRKLIETPREEGYVLDKDLANRSINWIRQEKSATPDRPFFLYLAPGTAHVPLQAPRKWIDKFKGKFDQGWDVLRQQTFQRQKELGVIPKDAELTPRPESIPAWNSLSAKEKQVASRLMEVFAAQLAHFDYQFGRVVNELKRMGEWQNTLLIYIDGDNGADGGAGIHGTIIEGLNGAHADVGEMYHRLDEIGGPETFSGYPAGWAWATNSPFQYTKQIASHLGGIRDGLVVSWPARIGDKGGLRTQFLHVVDVAPTIYDAIGIRPTKQVDGVEQMPFDGASFVNTFNDEKADSPRHSQYFEMTANRAYYDNGWMASTTPESLPWARRPAPDPEAYKWELYNLDKDYSQARNLADKYPEKLAQLRDEFNRVAKQNHVLPMNNDVGERLADSSLRPFVTAGRKEFEYYPTETRIPNAAFVDIKNKAWTLDLDLTTPIATSSGTLITQGGFENGWGLFLFDGLPTFVYKTNNLPGQSWRLNADKPLSSGEHYIEIKVTPDTDKPGAGGMVEMFVDSREAGTIHLETTAPIDFTNDGVGIGRDFVSPLIEDYKMPFSFAGEIGSVKITLRN